MVLLFVIGNPRFTCFKSLFPYFTVLSTVLSRNFTLNTFNVAPHMLGQCMRITQMSYSASDGHRVDKVVEHNEGK